MQSFMRCWHSPAEALRRGPTSCQTATLSRFGPWDVCHS